MKYFAALLVLSACTYNNDRPARSSDELARYNDAGQSITPDTAMYEQPAYAGDRPPVIVHHFYHGPGYYQSQPQRYYSDPSSVYNDPNSSLYHRNYGLDGYARAQAQAVAEASHNAHPTPAKLAPRTYRYSTTPRTSTPIAPPVTSTAPKVYRYVGTTAASKQPVRLGTAPTRTYTMPKAAAPTVSAPTRTYAAPRTYSAPAPTRSATPTYHYTPSAPAHH